MASPFADRALSVPPSTYSSGDDHLVGINGVDGAGGAGGSVGCDGVGVFGGIVGVNGNDDEGDGGGRDDGGGGDCHFCIASAISLFQVTPAPTQPPPATIQILTAK